VELPPAGYLPIDLKSRIHLESQVYRMLGLGVDLRFCTMRHDEAGFEFTRGQHLDRISLLAGLDDPSARQQVDILVPDGTWVDSLITHVALATAGGPAPAASDQPIAIVDPVSASSSRGGVTLGPPPAIPPVQRQIQPALDWVLFRRRSDVDCGSVTAQQFDTVDLWAAVAPNIEEALGLWKAVVSGSGSTAPWSKTPWVKVGELQFQSGASPLVSTSPTVQGWWASANAGNVLWGAAYAPATTSTDAVAIGRAHNLVAALVPEITTGRAQYAALTRPPPEQLVSGSTGALFLVTTEQSASVTVGVWTSTPVSDSDAASLWAALTGVAGAAPPPPVQWAGAGQAVVTTSEPPTFQSWQNEVSFDLLTVAYAGYGPPRLAGGAAAVQVIIDTLPANVAHLVSPPALVVSPPEQVGPGEGGSVFLVLLQAAS
jgi:hypothetical protein